jgi:adenosine deaminase
MRDALLRGGAPKVIADCRKELDAAEAKLGPTKSVVRYIYEVHRGGTREAVFAEMLVGFELATADPRVVAVNPVAAEDGYAAMANFEEQMQMFAFFHSLYPKVSLTMHAGELAPGLVPPEALRFHIRDSIEVAGAQRIGHGVDIMRETGAEKLLQLMASKPVPVEICLTSNDLILGVRGRDHPMRTYLQHGVPIVLASDDPGVSRGDLSTEFQRAVEEQGATYQELKQFARNSLQWSFLQGKSLWTDRTYSAPVSECVQPQSAACRTYLQQNPKAAQQWRLEERLREFEAHY